MDPNSRQLFFGTGGPTGSRDDLAGATVLQSRNIKTADSSASQLYGIYFNPTGTRFFYTTLGFGVRSIDLSVGWDLSSTLSNANSDGSTNTTHVALWFNSTGTEYYTQAVSSSYQRNLCPSAFTLPSSPNVVTIRNFSGGNIEGDRGHAFTPNGSHYFLLSTGLSGGRVAKYTCTTAYIPDNAAPVQTLSSIGSYSGIAFNDTGKKMYLASRDQRIISQFDMTTAYDLSTASLISQVNTDTLFGSITSPDSAGPNGLFFRPGGGELFVASPQVTTSAWVHKISLQ